MKKHSKSRTGCITCKKRRLKCDETKPTCLECARRKVVCGGYMKSFKWRPFEDTKVAARVSKPSRAGSDLSDLKRSLSQDFSSEGDPVKHEELSDNHVKSPLTVSPSSLSPSSQQKSRVSDLNENYQPKNLDYLLSSQIPNSVESQRSLDVSTEQSTSLSLRSRSISSDQTPRRFSTVSQSTPSNFPSPSEFYINCSSSQIDVRKTPPSNSSLSNHQQPDSNDNLTASPSFSPNFTSLFGPLPDFERGNSAIPSPSDMELMVRPLSRSRSASDSKPDSGNSPHMDLFLNPDYNQGDFFAEYFELGKFSPVGFNGESSATLNLPIQLLPFNKSVPSALSDYHEQLFKLYDRTCGILSIKDGPNENPWRTVLWPLAQEHGALYHAAAAMTKFHNARGNNVMRSEGMYHMKESFNLLAAGLSNKTIPTDIALATTLCLAFSESWDRHISTGIAHLRGAATMLRHLISSHKPKRLPPLLQFLFNSWLYLDVLSRLTSDSIEEKSMVEVSDDENDDNIGEAESVGEATEDDQDEPSDGELEPLIENSKNPERRKSLDSLQSSESRSSNRVHRSKKTGHSPARFELKECLFLGQGEEIDPLMGCGQTIFPLIGKVASLVQQVRKASKVTLSMVSEAGELKHQLETWNSTLSPKMTRVEDPAWDLNSCLATAESYRYAALLYLHQAVPEVPSLSSHELAEKVMMLLASIPTSSRISIIHIFPLLVAGCEAEGEERQWVKDRWKSLSERMGIGNVDRTVEVVKEVWVRKDILKRSKLASNENNGGNSRSRNTTLGPIGVQTSNSDGLNLRKSSKEIASSIATAVAEAFGATRETEDVDLEGIKGWSHWSTIMKEWGWEVLLG